MINLLPPKNKEEILEEENWKLVLILAVVFFISLFCFALILFSIKSFISGEAEAQKISLEQTEKEFQGSQIQSLNGKIVSANQALSQLDSFYQTQRDSSAILERISKTISPGLYLNTLSLNFQAKDEQGLGCSLSGFSPTREILLRFKENLEKEEGFEGVNFPPTSWLEKTDINFSVNFKIK
ncbi:MAG: hypothetical protein ABIG08_01540 [bacterium]